MLRRLPKKIIPRETARRFLESLIFSAIATAVFQTSHAWEACGRLLVSLFCSCSK